MSNIWVLDVVPQDLYGCGEQDQTIPTMPAARKAPLQQAKKAKKRKARQKEDVPDDDDEQAGELQEDSSLPQLETQPKTLSTPTFLASNTNAPTSFLEHPPQLATANPHLEALQKPHIQLYMSMYMKTLINKNT